MFFKETIYITLNKAGTVCMPVLGGGCVRRERQFLVTLRRLLLSFSSPPKPENAAAGFAPRINQVPASPPPGEESLAGAWHWCPPPGSAGLGEEGSSALSQLLVPSAGIPVAQSA